MIGQTVLGQANPTQAIPSKLNPVVLYSAFTSHAVDLVLVTDTLLPIYV